MGWPLPGERGAPFGCQRGMERDQPNHAPPPNAGPSSAQAMAK